MPRDRKWLVLQACIQPWIDEVFCITADIEGKLIQMNMMHALRQGSTPDSKNSAERVEKIQ